MTTAGVCTIVDDVDLRVREARQHAVIRDRVASGRRRNQRIDP